MTSVIEKQQNEMYEKLNKIYFKKEKVDRETVKRITERLAEIDKMRWDLLIDDDSKNSKIEHQYFTDQLIHKIVNNEKLPEPATIPTVLTLIGAAYFWGSMFDRYDGKFLFSDGVYCSLLNPGTTYNAPADRKLNALEKMMFPKAKSYMELCFWNDGNLNKNINRFFEITDDEIYEKMKEYLKSKN